MILGIGRRIKVFLGGDSIPLIVFFGLALLVTLPLFLRPGFVFLLDWAPIPKTPFPGDYNNPSFLFSLFFWFFDLFLPGGFLQKIFLSASFFLAGYGMFRFLTGMSVIQRHSWAAYFSGILYMFNPFVYSRALVGHWTVIMALALLPWFFRALIRFLQNPTWRCAFVASLWWTIIVTISLHLGMILTIPILIFSLSASMRSFLQHRRDAFKLIAGLTLILLLFIGFNSYWLIPGIRGRSTLGVFVTSTLNDAHIFSFFTRADPQHGVLWNTAAMYGFWGDEDQRYVSQKIYVSYWFYLFCAILALVLWGVMVSVGNCYRRKKSPKELKARHFAPIVSGIAKDRGAGKAGARHDDIGLRNFFQWWVIFPLILTWFAAFFFAVGVSYEPFKPLVLWFYHHVPFFRGFREPQKFVALLVFVYAIFGAIGIDDLIGRIERIKHKKITLLKLIAPALFLLIPLAYSPGMFWSFNGQIKSSQYPASWFAVDQMLESDTDHFRVLFLPWHQYIYVSFVGGVIANPAESFFHKPTLAGDNMEFGPIYSQSTRPESIFIEKEILKNKLKFVPVEHKTPELSLGERLNRINIKYVIWAQESDFFNYDFLGKSPDLILVLDYKELKVYRNRRWK